MAYNTKCTHDNEFNNIDIVKNIANTRMKIAQLLGIQRLCGIYAKEKNG